jgi:hypothetical protein
VFWPIGSECSASIAARQTARNNAKTTLAHCISKVREHKIGSLKRARSITRRREMEFIDSGASQRRFA